MRVSFLLLFLFVFFQKSVSQSVSGGGRTINMKNYWASNRGYTSSLGIDLKSEVNRIYLTIEKGPYFMNMWFKGTVTTLNGDRIEDEEIEYRFDKYLHNLHFRRVGDEKVEVLPARTYKSFVLIDEKEYEFIKLLPPLSSLYPKAKYYEVLASGSSVKLMKLHYSQLESYQVAGPSNDGRIKNRFKNVTALFVEKSPGIFAEIKPKKKSILSVFPDQEQILVSFEKKNGKIKTEEALAEFLNSI